MSAVFPLAASEPAAAGPLIRLQPGNTGLNPRVVGRHSGLAKHVDRESRSVTVAGLSVVRFPVVPLPMTQRNDVPTSVLLLDREQVGVISAAYAPARNTRGSSAAAASRESGWKHSPAAVSRRPSRKARPKATFKQYIPGSPFQSHFTASVERDAHDSTTASASFPPPVSLRYHKLDA